MPLGARRGFPADELDAGGIGDGPGLGEEPTDIVAVMVEPGSRVGQHDQLAAEERPGVALPAGGHRVGGDARRELRLVERPPQRGTWADPLG